MLSSKAKSRNRPRSSKPQSWAAKGLLVLLPGPTAALWQFTWHCSRKLRREMRGLIIQFYLYSDFSNRYFHKAIQQNSRWRFIIRSPMMRKNSLKPHEEETLWGTRLKSKPVFFRMTPDKRAEIFQPPKNERWANGQKNLDCSEQAFWTLQI